MSPGTWLGCSLHPGSSRAESRAALGPGSPGEKINTHCTSLDSCSAHGHRGIALRPPHPTDTLHGRGRASTGLGWAAALRARDRQGIPSWHQQAESSCQSWQSTRGQTRWAAQAGMDRSEVHCNSGALTPLSCSAHSAWGESRGCPEFSASLFEMNGFQRHRVSPTALASLQQDWRAAHSPREHREQMAPGQGPEQYIQAQRRLMYSPGKTTRTGKGTGGSREQHSQSQACLGRALASHCFGEGQGTQTELLASAGAAQAPGWSRRTHRWHLA